MRINKKKRNQKIKEKKKVLFVMTMNKSFNEYEMKQERERKRLEEKKSKESITVSTIKLNEPPKVNKNEERKQSVKNDDDKYNSKDSIIMDAGSIEDIDTLINSDNATSNVDTADVNVLATIPEANTEKELPIIPYDEKGNPIEKEKQEKKTKSNSIYKIILSIIICIVILCSCYYFFCHKKK